MKYILLLLLIPTLAFSQRADSLAVDSLIQASRDLTAKRDLEKALEMNIQAENIALEKWGRESVAYGTCCLNHGRVLYFKTDYPEAEKWYLESKAIREKVLGKENKDYATSLYYLGILYRAMGNFGKAEPLLLETKAIREKVLGKDHPDYAWSLDNLGILYREMGNFGKAEPLYLEAKAIQEKFHGKEHNNYAASLNSLAILYWDMGKFEKAEPLFLEIISIREKVLGKKHTDYALSLNNLGVLYRTFGNYEKAEPLFLEVKAIREKVLGKEHPDYARILSNLAINYSQMGKYEKAEPLFLESKDIWEKANGKEQLDYAATLNNLGGLYSKMGNYDKAESLIIEAIAIREKKIGKEHINYTGSLINLADIFHEMRKYEKAEPLYLEATAIREKALGKTHPDYALCLNSLAILYNDMGNYEKADYFFHEAKGILENVLGKEHKDYAANLYNLASLYQNIGNYEKSEPLFLESKTIWEKILGKEHPDYAKSLNSLAVLYCYMGDYEKAEPLFLELSIANVGLLEKALLHLSERELNNYLQTFTERQDRALSFSSMTGSKKLTPVCYDNSLFYKGFLLQSADRVKQLALSDSISTEKFNRMKGHQRRLAAQYAKPIAERDSALVARLETEANDIEKDLTRTVAGYGDAMRQVKWQEVQQKLQPGEAAIEFVQYRYYNRTAQKTDTTQYAALLLLPNDPVPHFISLCNERQLEALISKPNGPQAYYLQNLYASSRSDGLATLYELLWAPVENALSGQGIKIVYYSPSGLLHRLNLAAVAQPATDQKLADRYHLVLLGSTRELVIPTTTSHQPKTALVYGGVRYQMDSTAIAQANLEMAAVAQDTTSGMFGYSDRGGERGENWDFLPGTEREARHISDLLRKKGVQSTLRCGYDATEESFKQIGVGKPSPSLIHIGTHGFFFPDPQDTTRRKGFSGEAPAFKISEHPLIRSGLLLAGAQFAWEQRHPMPGMEDGILTAYEVSQMNLSNTDLVVLSACETGLGDIKGNEGVYGLQRAFRIAGAKNVMMSLWKVNDEVSALLLNRFYENWLQKGQPIRASLEEAQQWLRSQKKYENPYYWAGFVLVGE